MVREHSQEAGGTIRHRASLRSSSSLSLLVKWQWFSIGVVSAPTFPHMFKKKIKMQAPLSIPTSQNTFEIIELKKPQHGINQYIFSCLHSCYLIKKSFTRNEWNEKIYFLLRRFIPLLSSRSFYLETLTWWRFCLKPFSITKGCQHSSLVFSHATCRWQPDLIPDIDMD